MTDRSTEEMPGPFSPLSADELAGAGAEADVTDTDRWLPMMPAPGEPPAASAIRHHHYGTAARVWTYRNGRGDPLFATVRFESVGKDGIAQKVILPYTFGYRAWQVKSGPNAGKPRSGEGWHFKLPNQPLPLYGLDRLAARPDAPVLVCEGEKAADAAAELFPDRVCITSQGGSNAARKADWSPLAGRHVTVWPDNDLAGRRYADEVVALAEKAGARSVLVVNVPAGWPEGWDLADPVSDDIDDAMPKEMLASATLRFLLSGDSACTELAKAEIERLCALDQLAYAHQRTAAAKTLSMGVTTLDGLCTQSRKDAAARDAISAAAPADGQDAVSDAETKTWLRINKGNLPKAAVLLADSLAKRPFLFDRNGPCRLERDASDGRMRPKPLTAIGVINECHEVCQPFLLRKKEDGTVTAAPVTLPDQVAKLYLDRSDRWNLRPLDGIACAPLLHGDGSFRVEEGYDEQTRLWCESVPAVQVPDAPSMEDARAALLRLRIVFRTFAFADATRVTVPGISVPVVDVDQPPGADESALLVALLTAVCRPSLRLAPGFMIRAPEISGAGTGKGMLARSVCLIAYGSQPRAMTAGIQQEEMDKRIAAALLEAEPVLFLDNINGVALKSDTLASVLTEQPAVIRPLGSSTIMRLNSSALTVVTGNGLSPAEDMARRFLVTDLDAGVENPESREFSGDFLGEVLAQRASLLSDLLTIWRWGRQQGAALPAGRSLGSFTEWAKWCRDPLVALGCADPAARIDSLKAADPQRTFIAELFSAWFECHGSTPVTVANLDPSVQDVLARNHKSRQDQAAQVQRLVGTRSAGYLLESTGKTSKWRVIRYWLTPTGETAGETETRPTDVARRLPRASRDSTSGEQWSIVDLDEL
jgi:hypothetical protein